MKQLMVGILTLVMVATGMARAGYTWEYAEGKKCEFGADLRLRLTHWDRDLVNPGLDAPDAQNPQVTPWEKGDEVGYLRFRTRVWGCFDITEDMQLMLRLANRVHHWSSAGWNANNRYTGSDTTPWAIPDEVFIDNLYLDIKNVLDSDWSLRLGRQNVMLGNGMVVLEGTPYDQGRSIYFDGAVATYKTECDTVKLLALYNEFKDRAVFISDQDRRLRRGDIGVLGAYWTHRVNDSVNTDLYYIFADIQDDPGDLPAAQRMHPGNENVNLHIVGARVFGSPNATVDYSFEAAHQFGRAEDLAGDGGKEEHLAGNMVDARLTLKASEGTAMSPKLLFQYTYFSGDENDSSGRFEGWHPAFAEYPIFREELTAIYTNGNWSNLNQARALLTLKVRDAESFPVTFSTGYAYLRAEHTADNIANPQMGEGKELGHLATAYLDIGVSKNLKVALEAAYFDPSGYFDNGSACEWLRFQTVYTF